LPVTVSACVVPAGSETGLGVTDREVRIAEVTVTEAEPEMPFSVAETVKEPGRMVSSKPLVPVMLLMVPSVALEVLQCAEEVTFCWLPSLMVAVAVYCCVWPAARVADAGLTAIAVTMAEVAVRVEEAVTSPFVAVIVEVPGWLAMTWPVRLTVATVGEELDQTTELVRSWVEPSEKMPFAFICWLWPTARLNGYGVTAREVSTAEVIWTGTVAEVAPRVTVSEAVPVPVAVARPVALAVTTPELELR